MESAVGVSKRSRSEHFGLPSMIEPVSKVCGLRRATRHYGCPHPLFKNVARTQMRRLLVGFLGYRITRVSN
jgi:hypothetical protein